LSSIHWYQFQANPSDDTIALNPPWVTENREVY
jgi:hypothetical protein